MKTNQFAAQAGIVICLFVLAVLSCRSMGDIPNLFATQTPTPTITPSPTPTHTPSPTPLPSGVRKEELADGTTLFTDYDGRYQLTFPRNWVVVILEQDDINEILDSLAVPDESVAELMEIAKDRGSDTLRVFSFNFKATESVYTPNINVGYEKNPLAAAIPLNDLVEASVQFLPSAGIHVTDSGLTETSSGMPVGFLEAEWSLQGQNGEVINLRQKQFYFQTSDGIVIITLSLPKNTKYDLEDEVGQLVDSITLLD